MIFIQNCSNYCSVSCAEPFFQILIIYNLINNLLKSEDFYENFQKI